MATKVSKNLITSVDPSQLTTTGATAGQVLTYNASTTTWVASAAPGSASVGTAAAAAWVNFNGYNGVIRAGYNVSSVTRNNPLSGAGGGDYTINFTTPMLDANYAIAAFGTAYGNDASFGTYGLHTASSIDQVPTKMDVNGVRVVCAGKYGTGINFSQQTVTVLIFR